MISPTNRRKLGAFLVITIITVLVIGVAYMRLPRSAGIGVYKVSVDLPTSGGLYKSAAVSYRGVEIGAVSNLQLTDEGVRADLVLDNDTVVPRDVRVEVHSTSAIGEQYIDLIPLDKGSGEVLGEGDRLPQADVRLPVATGELLGSIDELVRSVPTGELNTVIDQAYQGLHDAGGDLGSLLDSSMALQSEATANLEPTLDLIRALVPVLDTQRRSSEQIKSYTSDLADFTEELAADDPEIRKLLHHAKSVNEQLTALYADLSPGLATLLADLATTGRVAQAYIPGLEHLLIVFPATIAAVQSIIPASRFDDPITTGNLDFKLDVGSPPVCVDGFADNDHQRSPHDLAQVDPPTDSYCKIAPNDRRVVRGARNLPCPNNSALRGPTAESCGLVFDRVTVPYAPRPAASIAAYDPLTGLLSGTDGQRVRVADLARVREPDTLEELMREAVAR